MYDYVHGIVVDGKKVSVPPPIELAEAWLCDRFHISPSQLDEEDAPRMQRLTEADAIHRVLTKSLRGEKLSRSEVELLVQITTAKAEHGTDSG